MEYIKYSKQFKVYFNIVEQNKVYTKVESSLVECVKTWTLFEIIAIWKHYWQNLYLLDKMVRIVV